MFALTFCYTHSWYTSHKVYIAINVFEVRPRRLRQTKTSLWSQMTENEGRTGFLAGARNSLGEYPRNTNVKIDMTAVVGIDTYPFLKW